MSNLKNAKLAFCGDMVSLLEGLGTETAEALIQWLRNILKDKDAHYFEFWLEEAEPIECMDDVEEVEANDI